MQLFIGHCKQYISKGNYEDLILTNINIFWNTICRYLAAVVGYNMFPKEIKKTWFKKLKISCSVIVASIQLSASGWFMIGILRVVSCTKKYSLLFTSADHLIHPSCTVLKSCLDAKAISERYTLKISNNNFFSSSSQYVLKKLPLNYEQI
jgi:hypothetical protein